MVNWDPLVIVTPGLSEVGFWIKTAYDVADEKIAADASVGVKFVATLFPVIDPVTMCVVDASAAPFTS